MLCDSCLSQIDTCNRNSSYGEPYAPGPEPKSSQAPITGPDAIYSGPSATQRNTLLASSAPVYRLSSHHTAMRSRVYFK